MTKHSFRTGRPFVDDQSYTPNVLTGAAIVKRIGNEDFTWVPLDALRDAFEVVLEEIAQALERGDSVHLEGLGTLKVHLNTRTQQWNPRLNVPVEVPKRWTVWLDTEPEADKRAWEAYVKRETDKLRKGR